MKPLALAKAVALIVLAVGLEAGFLLSASLPPRGGTPAAGVAAPAALVEAAALPDEPVCPAPAPAVAGSGVPAPPRS
jgi:hypothetical protein